MRTGSKGELEGFTIGWKLYYNGCINSFIFAIDGALHKSEIEALSGQLQCLERRRAAVSTISYNSGIFTNS